MQTTFKNFEDFAAANWPSDIPNDCTKLDDTDTDCLDQGLPESKYCASCEEYSNRCRAWDFVHGKPAANWQAMVNLRSKVKL